MPPGKLILGVDLSPIKPVPGCTFFQSDITTDKCRAVIRGHFKTLKADVVLHDGKKEFKPISWTYLTRLFRSA
jgi:AdoMet-dependent rRNA methyltransferase SPB1